MSERWSLTIVKANRVSPLGYILCIPLVICRSTSDSSSNLIHHACIISYNFIEDIFTAQIFATMF